MKYISIVFAFLAILLFSLEEIAEAKRFGGGRSFGGKSTFSSPAPKAPSGGSNFNKQTNTFSQNNAAAGAGAATASRGFGMGGLFGGLLAGTFIGSMLSGTPGAGGGLMDILIIGLLVFIGVRLFRSFTQRGSSQENTQNYRQDYSNTRQNSQGNAWDNLRSSNQEYYEDNIEEEAQVNGIDRAEFVEGAKSAFIRMQESWDKRDLDDIKLFTSPTVYAEIKAQAEESPEQGTTQILSLSADIHKVEKENDADRVSVYFTAFMREEKEQAMAQNITELWHFYRENADAHWKIDGIQQIN